MERVLVTGAASWLGGRAIQLLEARPDTTILAVDDTEGEIALSSDLVTIGLDSLEFADLLKGFSPTAVLHLATIDRSAKVGAERSDRGMVVGAQALFGAIARCADTRRVVIKSEAGVYGMGPRQPSVATEDSSTTAKGASRHQRRLREMEAFVASQAERHVSASYTVLRLAPIVGPRIGNDLSRYLALPVVPTQLGFDPRLQFISEDDALAVLINALDSPRPGIFNIAADGQLYLSRVLRLGRRVQQPLPKRALSAARRGLAGWGIHLTDDDIRMLKYGRVMDTSKAATDRDLQPTLNCRQAVLSLYQRLGESQPDA
ncbi:MAG: NAD-dependent epimerase/dehydratase family protein [Acidimicrobiia bacterium]|nr:NAD-dependent epimerase/dehydratase family protein [Acidimicrobiia bacterium]